MSKDPADYAVNNPNKKIGMLLGATACDVIWYCKTAEGVSINPAEISVQKYKEMLMATVKDALEVLGCGGTEKMESEIFGLRQKPKKKNNAGKRITASATKKEHESSGMIMIRYRRYHNQKS